MGQVQQAAVVRGVEISDFRVMRSNFPGRCSETGESFPAGTEILYKAKTSLTPAEKLGVFGNGSACNITVIWDAIKDAPVVDCKAQKMERTFVPSDYQQAIKATLLTKGVNVLISALAGCGKTATLIWLIKELAAKGIIKGREVYFLAFNASIRDEVTPDLDGTGVPALTTHQFCLRKVLGYKINKMEKSRGERNRRVFLKVVMGLSESGDEWAAKKTGYWAYRKAVLKLVPLIKNWAILPVSDGKGWEFDGAKRQQVLNLIDLYKLDPQDDLDPGMMVDLACSVISCSLPALGVEPSEYDFDDMLYHVLAMNLPIPKVDLIFVDEVQDLNASQSRILAKMEAAGTRIVAVGDKNQSIYMFRGADSRAWDRLISMLSQSRCGLEILELPINYRSLPEILDYARLLVPGLIGFREGKAKVDLGMPFDGMMGYFRAEGAKPAIARRKMAVICRNRAPLVQAGYAAIGEGAIVCFLGKGDLTKPLHDMLNSVAGYPDNGNRCNRISDLRRQDGSVQAKGLITLLGEHVRSEKAKFEGQEEKVDFLEELSDTAECIRVIADFVRDDWVDSIRREIDTRFVDKPIPGSITFTTVHGAKGLQWKVVFGIRKDLMPSNRVNQYDDDGNITDEYQQEINLDYIWRTRGEDECYVVNTWPFGKGMGEILDEIPEHDPQEAESFWSMQGSDRPTYDENVFEVPTSGPAPPPMGWGFRNDAPAPVRSTKTVFVDDGEPF